MKVVLRPATTRRCHVMHAAGYVRFARANIPPNQVDAFPPQSQDKGITVHVAFSAQVPYDCFLKFVIFQNVLENLPGVDPQSEAVKSAMGAVTGGGESKGKKDGKDKKKDDKDEDKK